MGMFDWLKCEYPLPKKMEGVSLYQTKSFTNLMEQYRISEDGSLYHTPCLLEFVEEQDRPNYGTKEWDENPLTKLIGLAKEIPQEEKRVYYDGGVDFYWYDAPNRMSHDYKAIFLDGKLVDIKYTLKKWLR